MVKDLLPGDLEDEGFVVSKANTLYQALDGQSAATPTLCREHLEYKDDKPKAASWPEDLGCQAPRSPAARRAPRGGGDAPSLPSFHEPGSAEPLV